MTVAGRPWLNARMTSITIEVPTDVTERLGERARTEGNRSVEQWLVGFAEREPDLDESRLRRLHGLNQEGYDSPRRTLPDGYFAGRKATLGDRVAARISALGK